MYFLTRFTYVKEKRQHLMRYTDNVTSRRLMSMQIIYAFAVHVIRFYCLPVVLHSILFLRSLVYIYIKSCVDCVTVYNYRCEYIDTVHRCSLHTHADSL